MAEVSIIGIDLAKRSFQLHGATASGAVAFRRKLSREAMLCFLARQPRCLVAMEACASAHHWGREIGKLGHEVRLIPPVYVTPFVKRQKNDVADAEAIAEAASRPTMRFVTVKSQAQQASGMTFRVRDTLVRQRTQLVNALRGHLAEFGVVAPAGIARVDRLAEAVESPATPIPAPVRELARMLIDQITALGERVAALEKELRRRAPADAQMARLMTVPGIGAIGAAAIAAFAPPMESFRSGRDFAAWVGLTPKQHSTGGKTRLGRTSKMGQRDIRRLLIIGAMTVVQWARRKGASAGSWLERMLARKPVMLVAMALANSERRRRHRFERAANARIVWAISVREETYRDPAAVAV